MRTLKVALLCLVASSLMAGCACRTKKVGGPDGDTGNIASQKEGPLKDVNFAFDSSKIDTRAAAILKDNAKWLAENPSAKVQIEGHCDERGTVEYNMALGGRRSQSCFSSLKSMGVTADRMSTISYGEELPLDPASNEGAWAKNRRCHFNVQGK